MNMVATQVRRFREEPLNIYARVGDVEHARGDGRWVPSRNIYACTSLAVLFHSALLLAAPLSLLLLEIRNILGHLSAIQCFRQSYGLFCIRGIFPYSVLFYSHFIFLPSSSWFFPLMLIMFSSFFLACGQQHLDVRYVYGGWICRHRDPNAATSCAQYQ